MALVKSGSLWRQSSILRRWKKNWFDLWLDGTLVYYEDENRRQLEDCIHVKVNCINIKIGYECIEGLPPEQSSRECMLMIYLRDGSKLALSADSADDALPQEGLPPEQSSRECMLMIYLRDGSKLALSADSADDALAWKLAFLETKCNLVTQYNPDNHYQAVTPNAFNTIYINPRNCSHPYLGPGTSQVWVHQNPCCSTGGQIALGMFAGAVTGTLLRSLMWSPCWL
ncbi:pleckstrin homology domain-containing family B member 1 [Chiloscyllium plagiosum]|uniref:pleckstrin homology domain-containing family B member 1 n=1 Tax=Chiloscyllium plagiosum TaxID=36176 RepID=UPI001CB87CAB|nr:pleckstrin homology domain-containing family B member 1 [Chiloscyllium plagiosum]